MSVEKYSKFRRLLRPLHLTPLHPQWLLGGRADAMRWLQANASGDVLDIGCADRWAEAAISPRCRYLGLDSVVTGASRYRARPEVFADAGYLPFRDQCFDTVLLLEVAEHLAEPRRAMASIARVLRPGGVLLLTMPFLYPIHDAPFDYQRYTAHGLTREMESGGLRIEALQPSLGSAETAGLLMCLSLTGMCATALQRRHFGLLLAPFAIAAIPCINLLAWCAGKLLPSWNALSVGYRVVARKPWPDATSPRQSL